MSTIVKFSALFLLFLLVAYSCNNAPKYSDVPTLTFVSFSSYEMNQAPINSDTTILTLDFTDGDGDIGFELDKPGENIYLIDNRTGEFFDRFRIPAIPPQGANNGVSGTINMLLLNTCCVFPPQDSIPNCESPVKYPTNELSYTVYLVDRAGNRSNDVVTPVINLNCN